MPAPILVDDMIDMVRDQIDENATNDITDQDIVQALNRAQDSAADILARHYPDPMLDDPRTLPMVARQSVYDLPEDIFESRLVGVEATNGTVVYPLIRIPYSDLNIYESSGTTNIPYVYAIVGPKLYIKPQPGSDSTFYLRLWVLKELETLQEQQGRITHIDQANNKIYLDSAGEDLTTESDNNNSYVNVVDSATGLIKSSFQIKTLVSNVVTFKSVPDRAAVYGKDIAAEIPDTVEVDDYICNVRGSCVPYLKKPFSNYMIQFAVVEIKRRLGEDVAQELQALKDFEEQVERTWAGREQQLRVSKRTKHWVRPSRRWLGSV